MGASGRAGGTASRCQSLTTSGMPAPGTWSSPRDGLQIGCECETRLVDLQAQVRRHQAKLAGRVQRLIVVVADTHLNRSALAGTGSLLRADLPRSAPGRSSRPSLRGVILVRTASSFSDRQGRIRSWGERAAVGARSCRGRAARRRNRPRKLPVGACQPAPSPCVALRGRDGGGTLAGSPVAPPSGTAAAVLRTVVQTGGVAWRTSSRKASARGSRSRVWRMKRPHRGLHLPLHRRRQRSPARASMSADGRPAAA